MKYAWITSNKSCWPISLQCEILGVSQSGYHEHFARQATPQQPKHVSNDALLVHIKTIHAKTKQEYGWPRIWKALRVRGIPVGKERVRKLMQLHSIKARAKRKYKATTDSNHSLPIAPNLLNRQFAVDQPNRVWTSDITYIATDEGWLYLTAVIDLFSRQVVGWSMKPHMRTELVSDALRMAWFRRRPEAGLIFHSDRGSQGQAQWAVVAESDLLEINKAIRSSCPSPLRESLRSVSPDENAEGSLSVCQSLNLSK